jgi:hypothetical protein
LLYCRLKPKPFSTEILAMPVSCYFSGVVSPLSETAFFNKIFFKPLHLLPKQIARLINQTNHGVGKNFVSHAWPIRSV